MTARRRLAAIIVIALAAALAPLSYTANAAQSPWITEAGVYPLVHDFDVTWVGVHTRTRGLFDFTCDTKFVGIFSLPTDSRYPHYLIATVGMRTCVNYRPDVHKFGVSSVVQTWVEYDSDFPFPPHLTYLSIRAELIHESSARPGFWVSDNPAASGTGVPPNSFKNGYSAQGYDNNDDSVAASYSDPLWSSAIIFANASTRTVSAQTTWIINGTYQGLDGVNHNIEPIPGPVFTRVNDVPVP